MANVVNYKHKGVAMDDTKEATKEPTKIGAKVQSRIAMIFSSLWIATLTILKGAGKIDLALNDIMMSGIAITAIWTPTYLSIFLDKIKEIRFGGKDER